MVAMLSLLGFRGGKSGGYGCWWSTHLFVCSSICILRQTHAHSCDSDHILTLCSLCNEKPYFKQLAMYWLHTCTHQPHTSTLHIHPHLYTSHPPTPLHFTSTPHPPTSLHFTSTHTSTLHIHPHLYTSHPRLEPRVVFSEGTKNSHTDGWTAR